MKIIVLAGGIGKRMWPVATDKCLIPFLGKPLLYHNLKKIKENIPDSEFVIISTPGNKDAVEKIAKELGLNYEIAVQNEPRGMADALISAKEYIEGEILVINAEDVLDVGAYKVNKSSDVVLTALKVDKYFPGGYIKQGIENKVEGIVEKPGEGNEPSDLVKLVVDYFRDGKKLVEYLEGVSSSADDVYEKALDQMISDGVQVKFIEYSGIWFPLKYPWHILDITAYLLSTIEQKIDSGAKAMPAGRQVSPKAIIEGNVIIEEGVKVFEGAVIKGPCYIGKNCIVGNNSMIRESILEEGCVTGFNSDITRSYIGANSWFHTNYIGDSVIEGDFGMGSGAVLANLRLDNHTIRVGSGKDTSKVGFDSFEVDSGRDKLGLIAGKGSRVGVNASTMPGARVGANSLVGPGVILYGDVKDNTKVIVKQELQESEHTPALTSYDQFRVEIEK